MDPLSSSLSLRPSCAIDEPFFALLAPLLSLYERRALPLPNIRQANASGHTNEQHVQMMPAKYVELLCHTMNMTPVLETLCHDTLKLQVIETAFLQKQRIDRWIALERDCTASCVYTESVWPKRMEFGSISIYLDALPAELHAELIAARVPFATLLLRHDIKQVCQPGAFFCVKRDALIDKALELTNENSQWLYGRCSLIKNLSNQIMAHVVEILPPLDHR